MCGEELQALINETRTNKCERLLTRLLTHSPRNLAAATQVLCKYLMFKNMLILTF